MPDTDRQHLDIWNVQTGHRHHSPRSDVSEDTLDRLRPLVQQAVDRGGVQLWNLFPGLGEEKVVLRRGEAGIRTEDDLQGFNLSHYTPGVAVAGRGEGGGSRTAGHVNRPLSTFFVGLTDKTAAAFLAQLPEFVFDDREGRPNLTAPWLVSWLRQPTFAEAMWLAHAERCIAWAWILGAYETGE